jgi:hypothetical protein
LAASAVARPGPVPQVRAGRVRRPINARFCVPYHP